MIIGTLSGQILRWHSRVASTESGSSGRPRRHPLISKLHHRVKADHEIAMPSSTPFVAKIGVLCVLLVAGGRVSLALTGTPEGVAVVWLPAGIALVSLTYFDRNLWPGIAIGSFITNVIFGLPIGTALGIAVGSTLGALTGAYALHLAEFSNRQFDSFANVAKFNGIGATLSALVSAVLGVTALYLTGVISEDVILSSGSRWWIGDALGIVVVGPLMYSYHDFVSTAES